MKESKIIYFKEPRLRKPILIEGLPGIGNVGRITAGYLVSELPTKKFAELYSPHFLPLVIVQRNGEARLLRGEFYYYRGKKRDLIFLVGDSQSITPNGYYEITGKIVELAKKFKVSEIISLGGLGVEKLVEKPRIIGAANDESLIKKYEKYGVQFGGPVENIVGISGLLLGIAKMAGIKAVCLLAETAGFPLVVADPIAARAMLHVLCKALDLKVDLSKLEAEARELEEKLKRTEEIQKRLMKAIEAPKPKEKLRYIE